MPEMQALQDGTVFDRNGNMNFPNVWDFRKPPKGLLEAEQRVRQVLVEGESKILFYLAENLALVGVLVEARYSLDKKHVLSLSVRVARKPWLFFLRAAGYTQLPEHDSVVVELQALALTLDQLALELNRDEQRRFGIFGEWTRVVLAPPSKRPLDESIFVLDASGQWQRLTDLIPRDWLRWKAKTPEDQVVVKKNPNDCRILCAPLWRKPKEKRRETRVTAWTFPLLQTIVNRVRNAARNLTASDVVLWAVLDLFLMDKLESIPAPPRELWWPKVVRKTSQPSNTLAKRQRLEGPENN